MILYRFSRKEHGESLSGRGAERYGGRWNSKGIPVIYCSESRALAVTEIVAYTPPGIIPEGYVLNIIEIPYAPSDQCLITKAALPEGWKNIPTEKKQFGDTFLKAKHCLVVQVPSALVDGEFNYLLNPRHPDFPKVKVLETLPFNFNERLFK